MIETDEPTSSSTDVMENSPLTGQPRRHHYVPQFYLAGFTKNNSKKGDLHVLDKERGKTWKSTPRGTAHKWDFHAIDAGPDGDAMAIEKALGRLEGQWSASLASVIASESLPDGDSFGDLMMFLAFMAVRVPRIRDILSDFIDRVSKAEIQLMLATSEGKSHFRRSLADLGHAMSDEEFEQLVQFGRSGQYDVNFEQTWHVQEMVRMAATLAPLLSLRKWCLWVTANTAPDFICSDSPVAPTWAIPMPGPISPAFGTPNTIVSVPLDRRIAMVSMIEEELPKSQLDREGVAAVNSMTAMYANQLYSSEPDFVWTMKDYRVGNASELLEAIGKKPA
jgi:hypothetical protein